MSKIDPKFLAAELPEVLDTLDSDRTDAGLSAAQGKVLRELIKTKQNTAPGVLTLYVDTNGNDDTGNGSVDSPYKTLEKVINVLDGIMGKTTVTICIKPGKYVSKSVGLQNLQIAKLTIRATDASQKPEITFVGDGPLGLFNHHGVKFAVLSNLKLKIDESSAISALVSQGYNGAMIIDGCELDANNKTAVQVSINSSARIGTCLFKNCANAVIASESATVHIADSSTDIDSVKTAVTCWGAAVFVNNSPNFRGKSANVVKNNALVIGL